MRICVKTCPNPTRPNLKISLYKRHISWSVCLFQHFTISNEYCLSINIIRDLGISIPFCFGFNQQSNVILGQNYSGRNKLAKKRAKQLGACLTHAQIICFGLCTLNMSADEDNELRDLVAQTLETNGTLGKIRVITFISDMFAAYCYFSFILPL